MKEKYTPKHKPGHLLIFFNDDYPDGMPEYIAKKLGYKMIPTEHNEWYIYDVGTGKEEAARKKLEKYDEFIGCVEKRDLRYEEREAFVSKLEEKVRNMDESLPQTEFKERLDKIKEYITNFKD